MPELEYSTFHFNKADDVKEIMSDLEHNSYHFDEAERELNDLKKADRIYNITLSRLES